MANYEFLVVQASYDNFRVRIVGNSSWRIEPANAACPLLVSGASVVEENGDLICRHSQEDIVVFEGASFEASSGTSGSGRVPQSPCAELGWTWLLESKED